MTLHETDYFSSLTGELTQRAARAWLGKLGVITPALRRLLADRLERDAGLDGSFLADPVFEATFGWSAATSTMRDLASEGLLHPKLVSAMDAAGEHRFAESAQPYDHQVEAWRLLTASEPRSVVVSSGTGSGKTECFLVPILDDLTRESECAGTLEGVRALFLYPLNALINSQRDRLKAWTRPMKGAVRFCLYNGETELNPRPEDRANPEEVRDRRTLRSSPPPVLVTNATMLEYMLVRGEDAPIVRASRGHLRWIVLDEAHTYVGSQAAEVALLLRRVLHAFNVRPKRVRFVATSATISSEGADDALRRFLADVAGVDPEQVSVVKGTRRVPDLPPELSAREDALPSLEALAAMLPDERYRLLASCSDARRLRSTLAEGGAVRLRRLASILAGRPEGQVTPDDRHAALALLDVARSAVRVPSAETPESFLPLRGHLFHRTAPGLWACCNPACAARPKSREGDDPPWAFGAVYFERCTRCIHCESLAFEVVLCHRCGADHLAAVEERNAEGAARLLPYSTGDDEEPIEEDDLFDDVDEPDDGGSDARRKRRLIARIGAVGAERECFDATSGALGAANGVEVSLLMPTEGVLRCGRCHEGERVEGEVLRSARGGAPFFLSVAIPTLLEFSPGDGGAEARKLPWDGRRTLTFSDSRQGTARFALMAQNESERNYVRSWAYHMVSSRRARPDLLKITSIDAEIAALEPLAASNPVIAGMLATKRQERAAAPTERRGEIIWGDAVGSLLTAPEIRDWMPEVWRDRDEFTERELASLCLYREFFRRPRRQNSLETLGLVAVRYPRIEHAPAPSAWKRSGADPAHWPDFLKMAIDHLVRGMSAVKLDERFTRWMGPKIRPRVLVAPGETAVAGQSVAWPRLGKAGARSRLPRLLLLALRLDASSAEDRALVNELLDEAWRQVAVDPATRVLESEQDGVMLSLDRYASLTTIDEAWVCPVTRRVLDAAFAGLSPYGEAGSTLETARCERITMPRLPFPFGRNDTQETVSPDALRRWLAEDSAVRAARERGVWTEFSDRIASFAEYFRVGEHSAQQSTWRLRKLEKGFKEGRVNLLSCSTTMEMGVDIGGLSTVGMNNAPPSPANYLQRAGRAGRRRETASVCLTLCQGAPHGEEVYRNPEWPFRSPIYVPRVSLQSEPIVQRHVNALLLGRFLAGGPEAGLPDDVLRLRSGWFFEAPALDASSPAERFLHWLQADAGARVDAWVTAGLGTVTARSVLDGVPTPRLLEATAEVTTRTLREWRQELDVLLEELSRAGGEPAGADATPAQLAISRQLRRIREEYLLSELASRTFLPGHGFPTQVVPFVNTTLEELRRERQRRQAETSRERDEGFSRRRSYPSRDVTLAFREYAPGADVVIDGRVYRSQGVTLNWHVPPGDTQVSEIQSLRWAWRCRECGACGTESTMPSKCMACGATIEGRRRFHYLRPAGFAVQVAWRVHNDVSTRQYVPVLPPWISTGQAQWTPLVRPELGRFRCSSEGTVVHYSEGLHGHGYALCLRCGAAHSETEGVPTDANNPLAGHHPLRGGKDRDGLGECPARGGAVKRNLRLGADTFTDVFELQLHDLATGDACGDRAAVSSIAVALRHALAEHLGIDEREIGWAAIPSRAPSGRKAWSAILFDRAVGGAGYVAAAPASVEALLRRAADVLKCSARNCNKACHGCLLTFDTQHDIDVLDRKAGLAVLTEKFFELLAPSAEIRAFGADARVEYEPLELAIGRELQHQGASEVRFVLGGRSGDWDFVRWKLRASFARWTTVGCTVLLAVPKALLRELPDGEAGALASACETLGIELRALDDGAVPESMIAEVGSASRAVRWHVTDADARAPGDCWERDLPDATVQTVRVESGALGATPGVHVEPAQLRRPPPGTVIKLVVRSELDGAVETFGARFWRVVTTVEPALGARLACPGTLSSLSLSDRYLKCPANVRVAAETLLALLRSGSATNRTVVEVLTEEILPPRGYDRRGPTRSSVLNVDWEIDSARTKVLEHLLSPFGPMVSVKPMAKRDVAHARTLRLTWADGTRWELTMDQGLGFLEAIDGSFNFTTAVADQGRALAVERFRVRHRHAGTTMFFVSVIANT